MDEFKTNFLGEVFKKATKPPGSPRLILATDVQLANEDILIFVNDMLNSGYIPGLWIKEDLEAHLQTLKSEIPKGSTDMEYFVQKLRKNVHICLCMSPVGDNLRVKARKFPGLVNATSINWFHGWP